MSSGEFNHALWAIQNEAGWWFWLPFIAYGTYGLWYLYGLSAAETKMGRLIRVLLTLSYFAMIFIPAFNGLGAWSFHFIAIASCLMVTQQYAHCKRMGKITPAESPTVLGRVVERMAEPPKVKT